uniref:Uncharacterized protein n=1 Tax=Aegilops tauschii TaxID=37682 RepID=M8CDE3_AEGTA
MCAGRTTPLRPFPFPSPPLPPPEYSKLASCGGGGGEEDPDFASARPGKRGNNGATMPGADDAFPAESRTTVFFGAVTSKSEPLTFQESLGFVKKVKKNETILGQLKVNIRRARNYMLYLSLFDILGRTELSQLEAYQTLQLLFRDHPDLHEGLEKFRPPMPAKHAAVNSNLWPWVFACAAVPLVAMSLIPALGNPVLWLVQQTLGEKMRAA